MGYQLGVDLGTTYSAAAVHSDGRASMCSLGSRAATIPSVVLLRGDGTFLTGEAAERRAPSEPERVGRQFKRRFGDTTPIIIAGSPYSAEALTARLLAAIVEHVREREGGEPERMVVTHPANWGPYKIDLLSQAVRLGGLDVDLVSFMTEPEAAAVSYAAQERVEPGEVIAVYDLGGGTFDAAVLRRTTDGFALLGKPEGIERLGGIDFDAAVFAHVTSGLGAAFSELDPNDSTTLAAVARLRRDCVEAKEALSSDTDASVSIMLPGVQTDVRITRQEFEALIRPSLLDSTAAMRRAVQAASVEVDHISRILLVGGSSRIPVVAQLVVGDLGRPLAVDAHPKHTVALGAAHHAGGRTGQSGRNHAAPVAPMQPPSSPTDTRGRTRIASPPDLAPPTSPRPRKRTPVVAAEPGADLRPPADEVKPRPAKARPVSNPRLAPPGAPGVTGPPANPAAEPSPSRATPAAQHAAHRAVPSDPPGSGSRRAVPSDPPGSSAGSGSRRAVPSDPPGSASGSGEHRARGAGARPAAPPGRSVPAVTPRGPSTPDRAGPGLAAAGPDPGPTAVYQPGPDDQPTALYQSSPIPRTSVYPGGGSPVSGGHPAVDAPAPKRRRPLRWVVLLLVLVALVVVIGILVTQVLAGASPISDGFGSGIADRLSASSVVDHGGGLATRGTGD